MIESSAGAAGAGSSASHASVVVIYGLAGVALLAACLAMVIVFMARMPRSPKEWVVGLISTVVSSLTLGSAVVVKFGLLAWVRVSDPFELWLGVVAIGGVIFACGLFGWAIVRWTFNFINAREGASIVDVVREVKDEVRR